MHIELTDLLRCPANHDEAFLVLLPDRMDGRRVVAGHLGCPICNWSTDWDGGVPVFGQADVPEAVPPPFSADDVLAMLGIEGPGGWLVLEGRSAQLADALGKLLPDVRFVAINPPATVTPTETLSVIRTPVWPIKRHAARGVVLGPASSIDRAASLGSALPGLRAIGEGALPTLGPTQELLAETEALWVVRQR